MKSSKIIRVGTQNYLSACNNLKIPQKIITRENVVYCYSHPHQFYYEFILNMVLLEL